jgi:hypothetical protein
MIFFTKRSLFISAFFILSLTLALAQEEESPYNARAYFEAEQNPTYQRLLDKVQRKESLTPDDKKFINNHVDYLNRFYENLPETEKARYQEYKTQWLEELIDLQNQRDTDILEENRLGIKPGKKFLLSNGLYGFAYGVAGIYVLGINQSGGIALPFLTAGVSLAYPLLNPRKFEGIDYSTVMLTRHGKFIGLLDGAALGFLMFGDLSYDEWRGRAFAATMIATSVALGEVGFHVGKKKKFPEGKVATYKYYSLLIPFLAFSGLVAGNVEDPHVYGATVLAAGAASYWYAGKVYKKYKFTRGDMLAASSFGLLSAGLGFGLSPLEDPWEMLIPAATALGGTLLSHRVLKNSKFTSKEGWQVNYASIVGALIGLGTGLAIDADSRQLLMALPAATGMAGWAIFASKFKRRNSLGSAREKERWTDLSFNFTPQNYFINKQIEGHVSDKKDGTGLPLFSLKLKL